MPEWFFTLEFLTLWLAVATTLLVIVAACQIRALRVQTRGWQTLAACERYDTDPVLDRSIRRLAKAGPRKTKRRYRTDVIAVLNYLDDIAIGIDQRLYVEAIVWDHMYAILTDHVREHLTGPEAAAYGIDPAGYTRLIALYERWTERRTRFRDSWRILPWRN